MSRSLAALPFFTMAAAAILTLGCQGGGVEPVAEEDGGRKYEAVDDTEGPGEPAAAASTGAASTGSGLADASATDSITSDGETGSQPAVVVPDDGATSGQSRGFDPGGTASVANERPNTGASQGDPETDTVADKPANTEPVSKSDGGAKPADTAAAGGRMTIPFEMPRPGKGVKMATYEPPKNATPDQLIRHLRSLSNASLKGTNQQEQMADLVALLQNRVLTSEMLMNAPKATLNERLLAVNAKLDTLFLLYEMGSPNVLTHAMQFAAALKKHPEPEMARQGRIIYLSLAAGEMVDPENSDPKWVAEEVMSILEEEPATPQIGETLQEAVGRLIRAGEVDAAKACGAKFIAVYSKSENKAIKDLVGVFRDEMGLVELDFAKKLQAAMTKKDGGVKSLIEAAETASKLKTRGYATLQVLAQSGQFMEFSGEYEAATKIYTALADGYREWPEEDARKSAKVTTDSALKRLALIGKPLKLEGDTIGGEPLDWEKYKGKVVLVDFWATWCVPCLQEIPNIQANYERYKDQGFEVIGYNLDHDPKAIEAFFKSQKLAWPSVLGKDPEKRGFGTDEFADSLGIDGIPFVVLINREGNVEAIHVRGPELERRLEEIFGPVEEKKPEEKKPEPAK